MNYLLLVFALNIDSGFYALSSFYESLPLRNFAWIVGENSGNVGTEEQNTIGRNLEKSFCFTTQ